MSSTHRTKGVSLAKGPVGLIGLVLLAYGISALIFGGHGFAQHAPNGAVHGKTWLGLEVNGFSGLLFIAAGLLLLLSAPRHWAAKSVSLIVGIALGAIAVIAAVKDHGALGLFAANHLTEIVLGAAAVVLIGLSLLPRVGAKAKQRYYAPAQRRDERDDQPASRRGYPEPPGTPEREHQTVTREQRTAECEPAVDREPVSASTAPVERRSVPTSRVGNGSRSSADLPQRTTSAPVNGASNGRAINGPAECEPVSTFDPEPGPASTAPVERRSVPTDRVGNGSRSSADLPQRTTAPPFDRASNGGSVSGDPATNTDDSTTTDLPRRSTTSSTQTKEDQHV
jgi:hypothetical protein